MKTNYKHIPTGFTLFTAAMLLGLFSAFAQEQTGLRERAERFYQGYQYAKATPLYLKLADSKNPRLSDLEHLADSYAKMNQYEDAENWYSRIVRDPDSKTENLLYYAEVLKQNSRYAEAKNALQDYAAKTGNPSSVTNEIAGCDSALVWMKRPTSHKLVNETGINTENSEFSVFPINNRIHFVGEPLPASATKSYGWTGNPYLRIYTADGGNGGSLSNRVLETSLNNGAYHIGPISSDASGNTLYVTRTYQGKDGGIDKENRYKYRRQKLELYIYQKDNNGNWNETPFPHNNVKEYSVGHASLAIDGNTLYFVSDMPGGKGGTDIWYSEKQGDGSWGAPQNAGASINTDKNELFPGIAPDGTLYFSSNGLPGMGGLDIFSSTGSKNQWAKVQNLKYPINSAGDDFAFIISTESTDKGISGFLSSNRINGKGGDDIYAFSYEKPKSVLTLKGIAYDKLSHKVLPDVTVTLFSENREIMGKQSTKKDGTFLFEVDENRNYKVLGRKMSYYSDSTSVSAKGITPSDTLFANIYLEPLHEVGKKFVLKNIHYDFGKHGIRKDAAEILNELVRIMRDNPTLKIELSSHTDSRDSDNYNMALSRRRAQSAVDYLVNRGIARNRVVAKGYGETQLLNHCSNGVDCSVNEHQANRRTEFTVMEF